MLTVNSEILKVDIFSIPETLTDLSQWVCWYTAPNGKVNDHGEEILTKLPCTPFHDDASTTDRATWSSFEKVEKAYNRGRFDGIGFVFSKDDEIVGLDLDNHFDNEEPLSDLAKELLKVTYVELSPSGTGAHAFFKGKLPDNINHRFKEDGRELELYDKERFFTVTGYSIGQDEILDDQSFIDELVEKYFKPVEIDGVNTETNNSVDIDFIKERMLKNEKVKKLFVDGDMSDYEDNNSQADLALCNYLAFWTGRNAEAMNTLFKDSALYRDKWDSKRGNTTYGYYTIQKAIDGCKDIYKPFSNNHDEESFDVWDDIVDYDQSVVPEFPKNIFPQWLEEYIDDVSESTQTPRDMACQGAIAALSTALSKKLYVNVSGDWIEPCNTYTLTLMPPGSRKSAVFKHMMKPITEVEVEQTRNSNYEISLQKSKEKALVEKVKQAENKLAKNTEDYNLNLSLEKAVQELENLEKKYAPTYTVDDATPEILVKLLEENKERLAIISAEGGIMQQIKGKYSDVSNLDVYLKGHAGDTIKVNRVSRAPIIVDEPLITVGVFGQPSIIRDLPSEFYDKGLMARFLYSIPKDNVGHRKIVVQPIRKDVKSNYDRMIKRLMYIDTDNPIVMQPNGTSQMLIKNFREEFEKRFRKGGVFNENEHLRAWADKYVGALMRIAILIEAAHNISSSQGEVQEWLHEDNLRKAFELDDYYIKHTMKAFNISSENATIEKSKLVLEKIIDLKDEETIKRSDIWRRVRRHFTESKQLDYVLNELEERNYIKHKEEIGENSRKIKSIKVNPIL